MAAKVLAATGGAETRLGKAPVQVKVDLPAAVGQHMRPFAAAPPKPGHLRLVVEGITVLRPGAVYQVYLNLPAGQKPDPAGPAFLGDISIFADPDHSAPITRSFDLASKAKALGAQGAVQLNLRARAAGSAGRPGCDGCDRRDRRRRAGRVPALLPGFDSGALTRGRAPGLHLE